MHGQQELFIAVDALHEKEEDMTKVFTHSGSVVGTQSSKECLLRRVEKLTKLTKRQRKRTNSLPANDRTEDSPRVAANAPAKKKTGQSASTAIPGLDVERHRRPVRGKNSRSTRATSMVFSGK